MESKSTEPTKNMIEEFRIHTDSIDEHNKTSLAFPKNNQLKENYTVFNVLPVSKCNYGFNFLVNSKWLLITNRESVCEHDSYNRVIRKRVADFFVSTLIEDEYLKSKFYFYLPKLNENMTEWWKIFVDDIKNGLKHLCNEKLENIKIYNPKLFCLFESRDEYIHVLGNAGVKISDPESGADIYEDFGYTELNIKDIFQLLNNDKNTLFKDWFYSKNDDSRWWKLIFNLLNEENFTETEFYDYPIFLCGNNKLRKKLDPNVDYFKQGKNVLKMWRKRLQLINFESPSEEEFLKSKLKIEELQIETLIKMIIDFHMQIEPGTEDEIWEDLNFLRLNYKKFMETMNKESVILLVPDNNRLIPITSTYITSLFGMNLQNLPFKILYERKRISLSRLKDMTLSEILSWELFLLNVGSVFPEVSFKKLEKKLELENADYPSYMSFSEFTEDNVKIAMKILNFMSENNLKCLSNLYIECLHNGIVKKLPIKETSIDRIFDNEIPCVNVPMFAERLAQTLGVSIDAKNSNSIIKVLNNFVLKKITDADKYIKWLIMLSDCSSETIDCDDIEIYVDDVFGQKKGFYKLKRIFCCNSSDEVLLVCRYTNQAIINSENNSNYFQISSVLAKLGCKTRANLDDLIETLKNIAKDRNNFMVNNILGHKGCEEFELICKELDNYFKESNEKDAMKATIKILSDMEFPLLQYDLNVLNLKDLHQRRILVCKEHEIIHVIQESVHTKAVLIDWKIACNCPNLMKMLNAVYFKDISVIHWHHTNDNPDKENVELNKIFCELTKYKNFRILKAKYLNFSISFKKDFKTAIRAENNEKKNEDFIVKMERSYAIIRDEFLVCSNIYSTVDEKKMYLSALNQILKDLNPNFEEVDQLVVKRIEKALSSYNWKTSSLYSEDSQLFNLDEIRFSKNDFLNNQCKIYGSSNATKESTYLKYPDHVHEEIEVRSRIEIVKNNHLPVNRQMVFTQKESSGIKVVNAEKQKRIGNRAEFFFHLYLKEKFGDGYNEFKDWKSPDGRRFYLHDNSNCDDSLGYDFIVNDSLQLFSSQDGKNIKIKTKQCLIEVKGSSGSWDGTFFISKNEIKCKDSITPENQSYIICIIENVDNCMETQIAAVIDWTENPNLVNFEPETFKATYNWTENPNIIRKQPETYMGRVKFYDTQKDFGFIMW